MTSQDVGDITGLVPVRCLHCYNIFLVREEDRNGNWFCTIEHLQQYLTSEVKDE
jgi:hypothetical protein